MNLNQGLIKEHAYLISRGVRNLAIIDSHENTSENCSLFLRTKLENLSLDYPRIIPFVHEHSDSFLYYGFAKEPWVLETYKWANDSKIPDKYREIIIGLLCGYNTEALRSHNDYKSVIM